VNLSSQLKSIVVIHPEADSQVVVSCFSLGGKLNTHRMGAVVRGPRLGLRLGFSFLEVEPNRGRSDCYETVVLELLLFRVMNMFMFHPAL
jgi:hypothetical protein